VPGGATDEADNAVAWPNIFAIRLVNIPIKTNLSSFAISGQLLLDFEPCLKTNSQYAEIKYAAALWFLISLCSCSQRSSVSRQLDSACTKH
jgi:hypothetical protein